MVGALLTPIVGATLGRRGRECARSFFERSVRSQRLRHESAMTGLQGGSS